MANPHSAIEIDSDDSDVEIVQNWQDVLMNISSCGVAYSILVGRKFGVPNIDVLRGHLSAIIAGKGSDYFASNSDELAAFESIKKSANQGWKKQTSRDKIWTKDFVAKNLAMLLVLRAKREENKKASSTTSRSTRSKNTSGSATPRATNIGRAFLKLYNAYVPLHNAHVAAEAAEANKIHRTPSLNYQLSGARAQDKVPFDPAKRDMSNCPVCLNKTTQPVESHEDVNAANEAARAAASANGGDGKFKGKATKHACYAYLQNCHGNPNGIGCVLCAEKASAGEKPSEGGAHGVCAFDCDACASSCQVVFDNDKRQTIATSILKKKKQQEKKGAAKGGKEDALVAGQTKFSQFLSNTIDSVALRECQQFIPGRSRDDLVQDIGSKVSLQLLGDPISTDLSVQRGLQQVIPRTTSVNYRGSDSKQAAQPKSITQARAELRGAKKKKSGGKGTGGNKDGDLTPPHTNFTSNKNNTYEMPLPNSSNRVSRNHLSSNPMDPMNEMGGQGMMGYGGYGMGQGGYGTGGGGGGGLGYAAGPGYAAAASGGVPLPPAAAAAPGGDSTMAARTRKRAAKKFVAEDTTPTTKKRCRRVRQMLTDNDPNLVGLIEDTEPTDSQEALGFCLEDVKSPNNDGN